MAPELLHADDLRATYKVDIYSFAMICWELIVHKSPHHGVSDYELSKGIIDQTEWKMRKMYCSRLAKDLVECYKFEFI